MITELIASLGSNLITELGWIDQIRTVGYFRKTKDGDVVKHIVTDPDNEEIGITDTQGNSGYIRFRQDVNILSQQIPAITTSVRAFRYTVPCKLVLVGKGIDAFEATAQIMAAINKFSPVAPSGLNNVYFTTTQGSSHSEAVHKGETGVEQQEGSFRVVAVDFNLTFDDYTGCALTNTQTDMSNCNCTNVLELPCVGHCDTITLEVNSGDFTTATVVTSFNGSRVEFNIETTNGQPIAFSAENLNADYQFTFQVIQNGEVLTQTVEDVEYDCFKIKIEP